MQPGYNKSCDDTNTHKQLTRTAPIVLSYNKHVVYEEDFIFVLCYFYD